MLVCCANIIKKFNIIYNILRYFLFTVKITGQNVIVYHWIRSK